MWNAADLGSALHDARRLRLRRRRRAGHDWALLKHKRDAYIERLNGIYAAQSRQARKVELLRGHARASSAHARCSVGGRALSRRAHRASPPAAGRCCRRSRAPSSASPPTASSSCRARPQRVAVVGSGYIAVELSRHLRRPRLATPRWCCAARRVLRAFDADARRGDAADHARRRRADRRPTRAHGARARRRTARSRCTLEDGRRARAVRLRALGDRPRAARSAGSGSRARRGAARRRRLRRHRRVPGDQRCRASTPSAMSPGARSSRRWRSRPAGGCADRLFGGQSERHLDYDNIPTVIFGHPPIGTVGPHRARRARALRRDDVTVFSSSFVPHVPRAHRSASRAST